MEGNLGGYYGRTKTKKSKMLIDGQEIRKNTC
jgi:hypothetical protein